MSTKKDRQQLYKPQNGSLDGIFALIEKADLTERDIHVYLQEKRAPPRRPKTRDEVAFAERRKQIVEWAAQIENGGAHIDVNGRLVQTNQRREPLPQLNHQNINNPQQRQNPNQLLDNEDEERQWLEREEREASEAIAKQVKKYREEGVPEEEFILVKVAPRGERYWR